MDKHEIERAEKIEQFYRKIPEMMENWLTSALIKIAQQEAVKRHRKENGAQRNKAPHLRRPQAIHSSSAKTKN